MTTVKMSEISHLQFDSTFTPRFNFCTVYAWQGAQIELICFDELTHPVLISGWPRSRDQHPLSAFPDRILPLYKKGNRAVSVRFPTPARGSIQGFEASRSFPDEAAVSRLEGLCRPFGRPVLIPGAVAAETTTPLVPLGGTCCAASRPLAPGGRGNFANFGLKERQVVGSRQRGTSARSVGPL